jgi:hypothetical protein
VENRVRAESAALFLYINIQGGMQKWQQMWKQCFKQGKNPGMGWG